MMLAGTKDNNPKKSNEEWFEVFVSGKSFPHNLAHISSKVTKKMSLNLNKQMEAGTGDEANSVTYFLHRVDL